MQSIFLLTAALVLASVIGADVELEDNVPVDIMMADSFHALARIIVGLNSDRYLQCVKDVIDDRVDRYEESAELGEQILKKEIGDKKNQCEDVWERFDQFRNEIKMNAEFLRSYVPASIEPFDFEIVQWQQDYANLNTDLANRGEEVCEKGDEKCGHDLITMKYRASAVHRDKYMTGGFNKDLFEDMFNRLDKGSEKEMEEILKQAKSCKE